MLRRTILRWLGIVAFILPLSSLPGEVAAGEKIQVDEGNRLLLEGEWKGQLISRGATSGKVRWKSDVVLSVPEQDPPARFGTFQLLKTNAEWATEIKLHEGRVILQFGREDKAFVLKEDGGELKLTIKYKSEFEGYPRKNSIVLVKQ